MRSKNIEQFRKCVFFFFFSHNVSVAVTEALKEHVPPVGGQMWDTFTHPLVGLGVGWTVEMRLGDESKRGALI